MMNDEEKKIQGPGKGKSGSEEERKSRKNNL